MRPALPGQGDTPSLHDRLVLQDGLTVEQQIQSFVERAIKYSGSAAALARQLGVSSATVCQWRKSLKKPDASNLIRIQLIALEDQRKSCAVSGSPLSDEEQ